MAKLIPITIPKWGIEMERGTISEWRVALGTSIVKGDELVDIETDKIINSFEATSDGVLVRIIAQEGEEFDVGTLIGVMASEPVTDEEVDAFIAYTNLGQSHIETEVVQPQELENNSEQGFSTNAQTRISPALHRKAERLGIDVTTIVGTGFGGRVLRNDIEVVRSKKRHSPLIPLQGVQKAIAEKMTIAKQTIPHFYLQRDCKMGNVPAFLGSARTKSGVSISLTHLLVQSVAGALEKYPELNLNVFPGGIRKINSTDVAIAVDTGDSLLTPVVRDIGKAELSIVAETAAAIVARARNKQLNSGELDGGAITVSNLGMMGVTSFTAIINPPQVMILSVGAIQERVVLREEKPEIERYCELTLGCDHRVINGAAGARFLAHVCETIEANTI